MTHLFPDLRLALRALSHARGFTAAVVGTLALGMTLCTTALVVLNAYLLTELPYPESDRLYWIRYSAPGEPSPRQMERLDWKSLDDVIEHPVAWDLDVFYLLGGDHTETAPGAWVTRGFIEALGIAPVMGRNLDATAFAVGGPNDALISHRLWMARFNGDPQVVGRTFSAYVSDRPDEAETFAIVGVLPEDFWHLNPYTDVIVPLRAATFPYMVRLRRGTEPSGAEARITSLVSAGSPRVPPGWRARLERAHDAHVASVRPALRVLVVAAGLVFLVACGNAAGLLLVRATGRERDVAVRVALGAGRAAIARLLFVEGLALGAGATVLSLAATVLAIEWLGPLAERQLGRSAPGGAGAFTIDWQVMIFAMAVSLLTVLVCALVPLAVSFKRQPSEALSGGGRSTTGGPRTQRVRTGLIVLEIAASLALLANSLLMIRSVREMLAVDLGVRAERILSGGLTLRQTRYPDGDRQMAVFDRIQSRTQTVPGIEAVALTTSWPLQQPAMMTIEIANGPVALTAHVPVHRVSGNYFETLGIGIVAGRSISANDRATTEPVVVISESLARRVWPRHASPLGEAIGVPAAQPGGAAPLVPRRIVGIARDVRQDPGDRELADIYVPMAQAPSRFAFLLVRTAGIPASAVPEIRAALRDIDPELALRPQPMQAIIDAVTARPRSMATLLTVFALAAAVLAMVGIYGVIAYSVRQREREIAVRLAVGASPAAITSLFVRRGALVLVVGVALGWIATLVSTRLLAAQLFNITPRDPLALALASGIFCVAGLLAVWSPARRAAGTDPAIALRSE